MNDRYFSTLEFCESQSLAPAGIDWKGAVDPELRREMAVADRAAELELELTVETLQERLDALGLDALRDRLDDLLFDLATKELESKEDWM